ncbi:hypothetical protein TUM15794_19750 [Neisseria gonorrhoeae]|nr:hypothetical protein TUM15747_19710 [Neisseria gonorrhoeae]GFL28722.1 hypothetical protein TUM15759_19410 [Neisseria gonorrhoeae]GFL32943.1 hypothetical protein TUM15761_20430 [Neisseria gonorrhoeae]GFL40966.1 hypothetical protein TUM15765_19130 [Neisseria gonorrhoeae]GFL69091.1 hypothetical protein TUM15779_18590 [Neisseria gonorrhoeae]
MCTYLCFFDWDKFVKTKKRQVVIIEELKMLNILIEVCTT